ncbi:MAG: hypothetical protein HRU70_09480 [Phycisphaeraceae bacterium]|nr:MAG: hypothetical protein HRU70_09480 [Phycisphaeraceae bacterium]
MKRDQRRMMLVAAAGLAAGLACSAHGQGTVINISGATLLENFVSRPAATNDYIDVDGDGLAGILGTFPPDQLAVAGFSAPFPADQHWIVQYRVVGSVNGFKELVKWGRDFFTGDQVGDDEGLLRGALTGGATLGYCNSTLYVNAGNPTGPYNAANPGGAPFRSNTGTLIGNLNTGGVRIDIAPIDVPSTWAVIASGAPLFSRTPTTAGYGLNPRLSTDKSGNPDFNPAATDASQTGGLSSELADLGELNLFNPANPGAANDRTLFDNALAFAPIATIVNHGVGLQQATTSELRHLFATGRTVAGENLMAVTRDVGSGTRNAYYNCIGLDPSWGVGDNIGGLSNLAVNNNLGAQFTPTNKGGNSGVENTVQNHRLGIGYAGAERGVTGTGRGSWLATNRAEIVAVKNDLYVGYNPATAEYRRPHIDSVLDNAVNTGYVIGGPANLITIGDPKNQADIGGVPGNTNPRMRNPQAAAFLNNIRRSTADFVSVPEDVNNFGMPGELLATQFILNGSQDFVHDFINPLRMNADATNLALQSEVRGRSVLRNAAYLAYNTSNAGRVPTRNNGTYTDGNTAGHYVLLDGSTANYDANMNTLGITRNTAAGDFNQDGLRNVNDAAGLVGAYRLRLNGTPWTPPVGIYGAEPVGKFSPEITGDFNGDGNFDAEDLRYWADGLAIAVSGPSAGKADRKAGFTALDAAFGGNLFGTQKSTGATYNAGDSRADIAGSTSKAPTRGFVPNAHDGNIDLEDLKYIKAQYACNPNVFDGEANWDNLSEAVFFDLSADLTGDLKVNADDVAEFYAILGTCPADFNLDGFVDFFDLDSYVEAFDTGDCLADFNDDGFIDFFDIDAYVEAFEIGC